VKIGAPCWDVQHRDSFVHKAGILAGIKINEIIIER
jgi:hypothetical protein